MFKIQKIISLLFLTSVVFPHASDHVNLSTIPDCIITGAKHMITGYDHILFLIGVVFFLKHYSDILKFITAFTIGHCITLILATNTGIKIEPSLIDAIIALSVIYKGFENLGGFKKILSINPPNIIAMVFIFGLIHGFGLSTSLQEMAAQQILPEKEVKMKYNYILENNFPSCSIEHLEVLDKGLPEFESYFPVMKEAIESSDEMKTWREEKTKLGLIEILTFNVGVELGQIAWLLLVFPLLSILRSKEYFNRVSKISNWSLIVAGVLLLIFQLNNYSHHHNNDVNLISRDWGKEIKEELSKYKQDIQAGNKNDSQHKGGHYHKGHYHKH